MSVIRRFLTVALSTVVVAPLAIAGTSVAHADEVAIDVGDIVPDGERMVIKGEAGHEVHLKFEVTEPTLAYAINHMPETGGGGPGQAKIQFVGPNGELIPDFGAVYSAATETRFLVPGVWTLRFVPLDDETGVYSETRLNFYENIRIDTSLDEIHKLDLEEGQNVELHFTISEKTDVDWVLLDSANPLADGSITMAAGMNLWNAETGESEPYTIVSGPLTEDSPSIRATLAPGHYVAQMRFFGDPNTIKMGVVDVS